MIQILNRVLSIALILAILGIGTFWALQHANDTTRVVPSTDTVTETSSQTQAAVYTKSQVREILAEAGITGTEFQKIVDALESPEYQDFLATDANSINEILEFLASQGVEVPYDKILADVQKRFRQHFPQETADELETQMREKLTTLFRQSDIQFPVPLQEPHTQDCVQEVMAEFFAEERNVVWMMERFQGDYFAFAQWAVELLQDAAPPVPEMPASFDTYDARNPAQGPGLDTETSVSNMQPQTDREPIQSRESHALKGFEDVVTESEVDTGSERIPQMLELANEERLETALRERFSPERFNRALQTLQQYGPEEGLRRLKNSDPAVATHIERHLQRK